MYFIVFNVEMYTSPFLEDFHDLFTNSLDDNVCYPLTQKRNSFMSITYSLLGIIGFDIIYTEVTESKEFFSKKYSTLHTRSKSSLFFSLFSFSLRHFIKNQKLQFKIRFSNANHHILKTYLHR